MIIKGNPAGNVGFWSKHLMRDDTNERAEVVEISGLLAEDLPTALREMEAIAAQSRCEGNFMYQANINPLAHEHLTPEQWKESVDTLEKNLGLEGHQRVVVGHVKEGRAHRHVIWNRVDADTLKVADMGGNWRIHTATARELEKRFGLEPTPTPTPTPAAAKPLELWEVRAAERSGIDPLMVKAELTELWRNADSGKAFAAAIAGRGYILAKGDRRDFCIIDQAGDVHSLARRLDGVRTKDVRERMADVDRDGLPTVAQARETQRMTARPATKIEDRIGSLLESAATPQAFAASLYREDITIARVDAAGLAGLRRDRDHAFQNNRMVYVPKFKEGELVAVSKFGDTYRLNPTKLDIAKVEAALTTGERTIPTLGYARDTIAQFRDAEKEMYANRNKEFAEGQRAGDAARQTQWREKAATDIERAESRGQKSIPLKVIHAAAGTSEKLTDFVTNFLSGRTRKPATPMHVPADRIDEIKQQRRALAAIEHIRDSMERGEGLKPEDVQNLTPSHLENIRLRGDDYVRELVRQAERSRDRYLDWGRERER
jgi:hypothetical protein